MGIGTEYSKHKRVLLKFKKGRELSSSNEFIGMNIFITKNQIEENS